jgi:hypothetical protein
VLLGNADPRPAQPRDGQWGFSDSFLIHRNLTAPPIRVRLPVPLKVLGVLFFEAGHKFVLKHL